MNAIKSRNLSKREAVLYELLATTSLKLRDIAQRLGLATSTVHTMAKRIYTIRRLSRGRCELMLRYWEARNASTAAGHFAAVPPAEIARMLQAAGGF